VKTANELRAELLSVQRELVCLQQDDGDTCVMEGDRQFTIDKLRERRDALKADLERRVSVE
jgi:hypothetical protein